MLATAASAHEFEECSATPPHWRVSALTIEPSQPTRGEPVRLTMASALDERVTDGRLNVSIDFDGIALFEETFDLAELI